MTLVASWIIGGTFLSIYCMNIMVHQGVPPVTLHEFCNHICFDACNSVCVSVSQGGSVNAQESYFMAQLPQEACTWNATFVASCGRQFRPSQTMSFLMIGHWSAESCGCLHDSFLSRISPIQHLIYDHDVTKTHASIPTHTPQHTYKTH